MASSSSNRPMESRTGRSKQRYNSNGERLVAGVVPLTEDRMYVLLIQSTRRKGWVLPKGGWESDEECEQAAEREAWEEAGIAIRVDYDLGDILDSRPPKKLSKEAPKSVYRFYEVTVLREEVEWPESHKRERRWFTYSQAKEALSNRPELLQALEASTIHRM
ncbi:NUDIX domain-containing protein [Xylaria sp. FL1042]|nr:NUDIX domain-containing protein [Xylaria sp. FL1042]